VTLKCHFKVERGLRSFIGKNKCPRILDILSEETNGAQFQASTDRYGVIRIEERNAPKMAELAVH
jgi:hypothetical protein